ncbi:MAG TPA: hypothetical protein VFS21_38430 [Roseiflexaceae bacterium]|nr:hypothetical protein [Roseiflexaceae bacterium]
MTNDDSSETPTPTGGVLWPDASSSTTTPTPTGPTEAQMTELLDQIEQALGETQQVVVLLDNLVPAYEARAALEQLQPAMRQAESAMHRLRQSAHGQNSSATNLSQHLTVLVLVVDMLLAGQLIGANRAESHGLLARNVVLALDNLRDLRAELPDQASAAGG